MTFNVRTLDRIGQLLELTASVEEHNMDKICLQEHRYYHSEVEIKYHNMDGHLFQHLQGKIPSKPLWRGVLFDPCTLKSLNNIEKTQQRMMVVTFNSNLSTMIISCYSPTNARDEMDLDTYNELSSLVLGVLKHNILIIGGDMNTQIGKNVNNKFSLHNSSNRNGEMPDRYHTRKWTKFQKRKGKLWTYTYTNNAKAQVWIRNGLIMLWTVRHTPLLKVCLPITEPSQLRYVWANAGMQHKQP